MTGAAEVRRLQQRMEATLRRAPSSGADVEVQADFAKYFCVLVSGFLENAVVTLLLDVAQRRSAPEIARFVERRLDQWTNPNTEKILTLIGDFNADWRSAAERYLVDSRKEAINSLVALRHQIAHGESVGTSMGQAISYWSAVKEVVEFLVELLK